MSNKQLWDMNAEGIDINHEKAAVTNTAGGISLLLHSRASHIIC